MIRNNGTPAKLIVLYEQVSYKPSHNLSHKYWSMLQGREGQFDAFVSENKKYINKDFRLDAKLLDKAGCLDIQLVRDKTKSSEPNRHDLITS